MEKQNKTKEEGLRKLEEFKRGSLRGRKEIKKQIISDYNLTEADLARVRLDYKSKWRRYKRAQKKLKREKAEAAAKIEEAENDE